MTDILIRGISKPTDCGKCFVGDRTMCVDGCPLDELPEHWDLIDRDAFREENDYYLHREFINPKYEDTLDDLLNAAPVIVPSNKEESE